MSTIPSNDVKTPHTVDVHVGAKVRIRRRFLGLSQTDLANAVGVTFQQVQKYERGLNRISASKLFEIAMALKVPLPYFFEGHEGLSSGGLAEPSISDFLRTAEGIELAETFPRIRTADQRRRVLDLIRSLSEG